MYPVLNFSQIAADMFKEHAKKLIQENISSALDILKSRNKATYEEFFLATSAG
jgi:hypothetical protein